MSNTNKGGRGTLHEDEVSNPAELPAVWRQQAVTLEGFGAAEAAKALGWCAEQLELALNTQDDVLLTIGEAAALSGYSQDHLRKLLRTGRVKNSGRKGKPLIRAADLPRKPGTLRAKASVSTVVSRVKVACVAASDEGRDER